jgi:heme oxygenase
MASFSYTMVVDDARLKDRVKNPYSIVNLDGLDILEIMSSPSTMYKWMIQQSHEMSKNMLFLQGKRTFSIN